MHIFDLVTYEEGRRAYHNGAQVADVALRMIADWERANTQDADHRAIEGASKSFVLGFAQGVIDDLRKVAGTVRRGTTA